MIMNIGSERGSQIPKGEDTFFSKKSLIYICWLRNLVNLSAAVAEADRV